MKTPEGGPVSTSLSMPAQLDFPSQSSLSSTTLDLLQSNGGDFFDSDTDPSEEVLVLSMLKHIQILQKNVYRSRNLKAS